MSFDTFLISALPPMSVMRSQTQSAHGKLGCSDWWCVDIDFIDDETVSFDMIAFVTGLMMCTMMINAT